MSTIALMLGGIEAQTIALQQRESSQQLAQSQQNVEEGWIAVLNPQTKNPTAFHISPSPPAALSGSDT